MPQTYDTSYRAVYPVSRLEVMPTLGVGQALNHKHDEEIDGVPTRWFVSRCTPADGETHRVYVEQCIEGRWVEVDKYAPYQ